MSKRRKAPGLPVRQAGFTIVELLIAGVLGLVLLAGVGQLFVGSSATFRMQRQIADVQDSGRFAMWYLKGEVERAGWFDAGAPLANPNPRVDATDGGDDDNDQLVINYEGTADCAGSAVGGAVINTYSVDNQRQLLCVGNGGVTVPLVSNVDSFQVLYGVDSTGAAEANAKDDCLDNAVNRFVTADEVDGDSIVAVRISLLIGGEPNSSVPLVNRTYQVGDRSISFNDQILRRVFTITAPIQNLPPITDACPTP